MTSPPWTPNQPLRADATDEQIIARAVHLQADDGHGGDFDGATINTAREFAAACVEDNTRSLVGGELELLLENRQR